VIEQRGPWKITARTWPYIDPWVKVQRDEVFRPDGQPGTYAVVHIKPGVCVLALDDTGHVHLTDEFHYAVNSHTLECVSGGRDNEEEPLLAAQRELKEELGIKAGDWLDLGRVDPFTASLLSPTQLFLARQLRFTAASPEGTEQIRHVVMPLSEAVQRVMRSEITHAPSTTLILKVAHLLTSLHHPETGIQTSS
jgi:ADP-ribose pyrophosphatase